MVRKPDLRGLYVYCQFSLQKKELLGLFAAASAHSTYVTCSEFSILIETEECFRDCSVNCGNFTLKFGGVSFQNFAPFGGTLIL